jgi:Calcineurin-like phosphoesterase
MKAVVLQLSDLHLKSKGNSILDKLDKIKGAVNADGDVFRAGFIVLSGDIAFSGKSEEYTLALELVDQLRDSLQGAGGVKEWHIIPTPGNHDCDLGADDETRKTLSESLIRNPSRAIDSSLLTNCLKVQKNYFEFCSLVTNLTFDDPKQQLCSTFRVNVGNDAILFRCYNTAWLSKKPEKQGELLVPLNFIKDRLEPGTVILSILHHPYNWFPPEPARDLQRHLEDTSDIILTGHEHENEQFQKVSISGHGNDYLEGGTLQDSRNPNRSSFNLIELDLDAKKHRIVQYEWHDHYYKELRRSEWKEFWRAKSHTRNAFPISASHLQHLNDPGAQFTHPRVEKLTLQHIFVPPDFRQFAYEDAKDTSTHDFVDGDEFLETLGADKYVLATGPEKSGRTALCKTLFLTAHGKGTVPILIHGSKLRKGLVTAAGSEGLDKLLRVAFAEQYSTELYEQFRQLGKSQRALIIEDFHLAELNSNGKRGLLTRCREIFEYVWIVGDEILLIEEIQNRDKKAPLYSDHRSLQIRALGKVKRERLITDWYLLGAEDTITEKDLNMRIRHATQVVDTVIGRSFLPAFPIFILTILQQIEASTSHKTASGSYGYFYEFLITRSLSNSGAARDLDLKYNYLSVLAHFCFEHQRRSVSESELMQIHQAYEQDYKIRIPYEKLKRDLFGSAILSQTPDGQIGFHYRYVYYYFIALYFANNLHEPATITTLERLAKGIHKEEFANILIFLSYLSKAPAILDAILTEAKKLYPDSEICKLGSDVEYLNKMQARVPKLILETRDPKENRKRVFGALDREVALQDSEDTDAANGPDPAADEKAYEEIIRVNKAFKTVEVLGQILKNYTGSLKGDKKLLLARECCCLGLRTMEFIIQLIDENLEPIISLFAGRLRERDPNLIDNDLVDEIKGFLFMLCSLWAFANIKRISHAIGSDQLEQTYAELDKELDATSIRMVNFATKMEHFSEFPEREALDLAREVKDNYFALNILKHLVISHFYLFSVDHAVRDRVCKRLEIPIEEPKALDERTKIS